MRKIGKVFTGLTLGLAVTVPIFFSAPAYAANDENGIAKEIVKQIDGGYDEVVVIDPAKLSNTDLLDDKYFESYTSIVAVDSESLGSYDPEDLSRFIVENDAGDYATGLNILAVTEGKSAKLYISAIDSELEASVTKLFGAPGEDGGVRVTDPGWEILRQADAIYSAQREYAPQTDASLVLIILGSVVGGIAAIGFGIWGIVSLTDHRRRTRWQRLDRKKAKLSRRAYDKNSRTVAKKKKIADEQATKLAKKQALENAKTSKEREAKAAGLTSPLERHIKLLNQTSLSVKADDERLSKGITLVLERFMELRESITLMGIPVAKRDILYVEYEDRLEKLVTLVGPKYYEDIKRNPTHWRDSQEKLDAIRLSFEKTGEQLLENIIQLKEGSEFDFELAIDGILGFKVIDAKQMLNGKN